MTVKPDRFIWIDSIRAIIILLVIADHTALAYTTFGHSDKDAYIKSSHPIIDSQKSEIFDVFQNFIDVVPMPLMFFIGGLFFISSYKKYGVKKFLIDKTLRLFLPFMILSTIFMMLAYIPAYQLIHPDFSLPEYLHDFFFIENWSAGPPWFIWILFAFNLILVATFPFLKSFIEKGSSILAYLKNKPLTFFFIFVALTWLVYTPVAYLVGDKTWIGFGPFDLQPSRFLLYFGYFSIGVLIGNTNFNDEILAKNSSIVKKWQLWSLIALCSFILFTILPETLNDWLLKGLISELHLGLIYSVLFAATCCASFMAIICSYRKLVETNNYWLNSLMQNSYMMFLLHYMFVLWGQYFVLKLSIPAPAKFIITFTFALTLSWLFSLILRRIKIIEKYV